MSRSSRLGITTILGLVVGAAFFFRAGDASALEPTGPAAAQHPQATEVIKTCTKCHDEPPVTFIFHRAHGQMGDARTPFSKEACETCHGTSPQHLETPEKGKERAMPDIVFGRKSPTPAAEQNKVCLGCHQSGLRINWEGSPHQSNDVPCAACHKIHALQDQVRVKSTQPMVCFQCHKDVRAQAQRYSHHPIREGKVVCSDCHNPHGSMGPDQLKRPTVNEVCYLCHTEKRGPFLWEHPPVVEDCRDCHTPHGSTQPRLLKIRPPFLCQTCHMAVFHPSSAYSGTGLPPPTGSADAHLLVKGCLNCHSQVHGSNNPSGALFLR
jgi:DmsE family decaheme c-type cytochrome